MKLENGSSYKIFLIDNKKLNQKVERAQLTQQQGCKTVPSTDSFIIKERAKIEIQTKFAKFL